jgi:predicted ABC-type transport system involved in lysophospholipase L1 biosynthesis ATPase subunit
MPRAPGSAAGSAALLSFADVGKSYPDGGRRIVVLERASFEVHAGDFVGVLGARRTGKSTLLRLAAGIELADSGTISIVGKDIARMSLLDRDRLLRSRIGLLSSDLWRPGRGERVVDLVALPLISDGATLHEARRRARRMLHWAGAVEYADDLAETLAMGERMRALLARALIREPRLLLVDEPAAIPSLSEREEVYALLCSAVRERGAALVVASEDAAPLRGATVMMSIGDGELCSTGEPGVVLPFPDRRAGGMERFGS